MANRHSAIEATLSVVIIGTRCGRGQYSLIRVGDTYCPMINTGIDMIKDYISITMRNGATRFDLIAASVCVVARTVRPWGQILESGVTVSN